MDSLPTDRPYYAGEFFPVIDEKNRLTVPKSWRSNGDADLIILSRQKEQCLRVMSPDEFARMSIIAENDTTLSATELRIYLRQLHANARHGTMDKQGRLVLPDELCRQLDLRGEVALIGGRGRFEIWNLENWKRVQPEENPIYDHVADRVER